MHDESQNVVIVVEGTLTEIYVAFVDDWIEIALFIKDKLNFKVNIKVFENEFHLAVRWHDPSIDVLLRCYLPVLERGKIELEHTPFKLVCERNFSKLKFYLAHVEINFRIFDICPIYDPVEQNL